MSLHLIDHLTDEQILDLDHLYQAEWWTRGRQLPDIRKMLENTDVLAAFCDSDSQRLIAFARVITDYTYKALILDVIVDASYRGKNLGRALMDAIVAHPRLKSVKHFELYCLPELVSFYKKWGFTDELGELRFMRRVKPVQAP
ncbi:MAG: GNAT family N-acetyltransferase [Terriglobia bacterium]